ncbi:MAG: DUF1822 family protein [Oscillatoria sp. SIO1A7]|nr:DUF1822 family protein [Oscillatoria sp. SIO1A7]
MPPRRRDVIQKFVSMVAVKDNSKSCPYYNWELDRQLASHLELCQQRDPQLLQLCQDQKEIDLFQYWLELLPTQPKPSQERRLIRNHIFAYLEAPRYWAASNRFNAYTNLDYPEVTWASYMFIAGAFASDPKQVLEAFQKYDRNRETRLEFFFKTVLERKIQEGYYKECKTGKYSLWFELKKITNKKLKKNLQLLGLWERQYIDRYVFARDCLFQVYRKTGDRWLEPSPIDYQRAADLYNRHNKKGDCISWQMLEAWIDACISALQLDFKICSLDEVGDRPWLEQISCSEYFAGKDPLSAIEEEEFAEMLRPLQASLNEILKRALKSLEPIERKMLELHYGKKLTGAKVGEAVGRNQSNVTRGCQRCLRRLLEVTAEWIAKQNLELEINQARINGLKPYIKEWVEDYYQPGLEKLAIEPVLILSPYKPEQLLEQPAKQTPDSPELEQPLERWAALLQNQTGRQQPHWQQAELPALSQWLGLDRVNRAIKAAGWQQYEEVFDPRETAALARRSNSTEQKTTVSWVKQIDFGKAADPPIALVIHLMRDLDQGIQILPQVRPIGELERQLCLPEGLQMIVLDESGETFDRVRAGRASNLIQLDDWLSDSPGGRFGIKLVWGKTSATEQFVI